jgi:hypothetical protein
MKTTTQSHSNIEAADRDNIIGRAISTEMASIFSVEPCPTAELLAVLVDGCASEEERDRLFGHLALCERCRQIYLLAHELRAEEPAQKNQRGWYIAGGSLAAVALLVLAVKLAMPPAVPPQQIAQAPVQQQTTIQATVAKPSQTVTVAQQAQIKDVLFSVTRAARQLAKAASADSLAVALDVPASGSYGFAGGGSQKATAFKAGTEVFELELWLAAGDKERAGLAGVRLSPLLKASGSDEDLLRKLEEERFDEVSRQLEAIVKTSQGAMIRLGSWAAAARVATHTGTDPYFAGNPPQQFLKELGTELTPVARETLRKLNKNKVGNDPAEIRRLLAELSNSI